MTAMSLPEGEQMKTARPATHQVKPAKKEMSHCPAITGSLTLFMTLFWLANTQSSTG